MPLCGGGLRLRNALAPSNIVTPRGPLHEDAAAAHLAQQAPPEVFKALREAENDDAAWIAIVNTFIANCMKDGRVAWAMGDAGRVWMANPFDRRIAATLPTDAQPDEVVVRCYLCETRQAHHRCDLCHENVCSTAACWNASKQCCFFCSRAAGGGGASSGAA